MPLSTQRALVLSYAGYLVRYVYLLILIPFYGRVLGVAAYGKVLAAMSLYTVVWTLTNYGFSTLGARDVASTPDPAQRAAQFGRHLHGRLMLSLVGGLVGVVGTLMSPSLRAEPLFGVAATALGLVQSFNLGWYFQGLGRFPLSTGLEVVGFVVSLALILLLVQGPDDAVLVLVSLLASAVVTTVLAYVTALRSTDRRQVRIAGGPGLIRDATPIFLLGGITTLSLSASTYVLSLFAPASEVGAFGSAERLAGIVLALMVPANQVLVSTVSQRLSAHGDGAAGFAIMRWALALMVAAGCVACALVAGLAPWLVPWVLGPQFGASVGLLQTLALMYPFFAFTQVINLYVLIPLRKDALAMRVTAVGTLVQLLAFVVLAWQFSGQGAAWARLLGEGLTAVLLAAVLVRTGLWRTLRG